MMNNAFLNSVNKTIGENMRFVKNYDPSAADLTSGSGTGTGTSTGGTGTTSAGATAAGAMDTMTSFLTPMMMIMMLSLISSVINKIDGTSGQSAMPLPYIPGVTGTPTGTGGTTGTGGVTDGTGTDSVANNPVIAAFDDLFNQKAIANPDATAITLDDSDIAGIKTAIDNGTITSAQVGQALKYELDTTPEKNLPAIVKGISELTDSGYLNTAPFLDNSYLSNLSPARTDALMQAVQTGGLIMADGAPNNKFISFMLDSLNQDDNTNTRAFLQDYLQSESTANAGDTTSARAQALNQILQLSGTTMDPASYQLTFTKPATIVAPDVPAEDTTVDGTTEDGTTAADGTTTTDTTTDDLTQAEAATANADGTVAADIAATDTTTDNAVKVANLETDPVADGLSTLANNVTATDGTGNITSDLVDVTNQI
jgi:hypothetical protein